MHVKFMHSKRGLNGGDLKSVQNKFCVLHSLKGHYEEALRRNDVKAIVLTGIRGIFSGGLDLNFLRAIRENELEEIKVYFKCIRATTGIIEAAGKPLVAAIDGPALGGGLEISLACQAHISTASARFALPELQLGLITAFGGTQRFPRLVGLTNALEMLLMSTIIKAEEAHQLGLVDAIVSLQELLSTACCWALDIHESKRPWIRALSKTDKLGSVEEAREILNFAKAQAQKQAPNLKHPLICIDVIEEGIVSGSQAGLQKEAIAFEELLQSDTCKSLLHVYFSKRAAIKIPGVTDLGLKHKNVTKVAIVGGGLMGSGIATALILSHCPVLLKEVNEKFLNVGLDRIKDNLQSCVRKGKIIEDKYENTLSLLTGVLDYERFKEVDLVIEAVNEDVKLKQQIFADLGQHYPSHCILATSTSTIDLNLIGQKTNCQDRIVGAHFFSPAHVMPLLEIVRSKHTSPQIIIDLLGVAKKIKKTPIVVGSCQSALLLVDRGMDLYKIDRACTQFGMPMGTFRLLDLVGFEVALATGMQQYLENFPDRVYKSMLIPLMIQDKKTGKASQKGFYTYEGNRKATPDPEVMKYVEKSRSLAGAMPDPEIMKLDDKDIVET